MRIRIGIWGVGLAVVVSLASPASAQQANPKLMASVGFGQADPLPLQLPFKARAWTAAIQFATGKHLTIEAAASGWRHVGVAATSSDVFSKSGTTIVYTHADFSEDTRDAMYAASLSAIATADIGRLRLSSGAGGGISVFTAEVTETVVYCSAPGSPACQPYHSRTVLPMFAVHCILGADVTVTPRWRAFVSYRLAQSFSEALADITLAAGVTFVIK